MILDFSTSTIQYCLPCEIKMHDFLEIIEPKRELQDDDKYTSTLSHEANYLLRTTDNDWQNNFTILDFRKTWRRRR